MKHLQRHNDLIVGLLRGKLETSEAMQILHLLCHCPGCPKAFLQYEKALDDLGIPYIPITVEGVPFLPIYSDARMSAYTMSDKDHLLGELRSLVEPTSHTDVDRDLTDSSKNTGDDFEAELQSILLKFSKTL